MTFFNGVITLSYLFSLQSLFLHLELHMLSSTIGDYPPNLPLETPWSIKFIPNSLWKCKHYHTCEHDSHYGNCSLQYFSG
jgi:hypothetical protein